MDEEKENSASDLHGLLSLELPRILGELDSSSVLGSWPGGLTPAKSAAFFDPPLYDIGHHHPHPEICLLLSGRCRLSLGSSVVALIPGQLVLIPPRAIHAETFLEPSLSYRLGWWILPPAEPLFQTTAYQAQSGFSVVHRTSLVESAPSLETLSLLATAGAGPALLPFKEALLSTLTGLMRRYREPGASMDQRPQVVDQALEYIRDHLHGPLDLAEVGRAVMLSPNYLTTLFKQHTGFSLGQTIKRLRIERACALLRDTRLQIQEISTRVGFSDPFAFSKAFRRHVGVAPRNYRENPDGVTMDSHS